MESLGAGLSRWVLQFRAACWELYLVSGRILKAKRSLEAQKTPRDRK